MGRQYVSACCRTTGYHALAARRAGRDSIIAAHSKPKDGEDDVRLSECCNAWTAILGRGGGRGGSEDASRHTQRL